MILQTDSRFRDPRWKQWGCNLMTCFYFANKYGDVEWNITSMLRDARHFMMKEWVDQELAVLRYDLIYEYLCLEVEWVSRHEHFPDDYVCAADEFEHVKWVNTHNGKTIGHFTGGNGYSICTYDPWGDSNCVRYGYAVNKRIFRRIG